MIERLIRIALLDGIADLTAHPDTIARLFRDGHGLLPAEVETILAFFAARPPNVYHGYPRLDQKFPAWNIVLSNEAESQQFLGDYGGVLAGATPGDPDDGATIGASIEDQNYMVLISDENPDVVLYYYQIAKFLLKRAREFFKAQGLVNLRFSGGDLSPNMGYIPAHLFGRQLTCSCTIPDLVIGAKDPAAFQITGLFLNDGTGFAAGGVKASINTYDPEIE